MTKLIKLNIKNATINFFSQNKQTITEMCSQVNPTKEMKNDFAKDYSWILLYRLNRDDF